MELHGTLNQFPLSELMSLMASCTVTGALEIQGENENGQVFCRSGRMTHAQVGELRGMAALEHLIELGEASFTFNGGAKASEETLWGDPWMLIGLVIRRERLLVRIRMQIPNLHCVPQLSADGVKEGVRIPIAAWPIITTINSQRTVYEVATTLGYDLNDVALAITWLVKRGLVAMRSPRRAQPLLRRLSPKYAAHALQR